MENPGTLVVACLLTSPLRYHLWLLCHLQGQSSRPWMSPSHDQAFLSPNNSFTAVPWDAYLLSDSSSWFSEVPSSHMQVGPETSSSVTCTHDPDYPWMPDIRASGASTMALLSHSPLRACSAKPGVITNERNGPSSYLFPLRQLVSLKLFLKLVPCQPVSSLDNKWWESMPQCPYSRAVHLTSRCPGKHVVQGPVHQEVCSW